MTKTFRNSILACTAVVALVMPALAGAQTVSKNPAKQPDAAKQPGGPNKRDTGDVRNANDALGTIIVTGTRIVQNGFQAPVPVTVVGDKEIQALRPTNLANVLNSLPATAAAGLTTASNTDVSGGTAGINAVNLRALGRFRTLVLLDGHRTVPSSFDGAIDINTFPQDLVERIEVVTGGASAQYGADAIGGVVNFILNDKFKGLRLGADTSETTYGDGHNYRLFGSAGLSLLDGRLHILLNGDYFHQNPVKGNPRPWANSGYFMIPNPAYTATNGQPQFYVGSGIGLTNRTKGGIIPSGPLAGTYFISPGNTGTFNYGTTSAASSPWMIGGDWQLSLNGAANVSSLIQEETRSGVFSRVSFEANPNVTVYGQFSWNRYQGQGIYGVVPANLTISADNGYLVTQYPQIAAAMRANNLSSIVVNTWNGGFPLTGFNDHRQVFRYIAGAKGKFSLFARPWSWEAYFQHGLTETHEQASNVWKVANLALATDAVVSNGQIVCRSTLTNPTNGCVPIDRLGSEPLSAAAQAYIYGPQQPLRNQTFKEDVASLNVNGQLFNLPGGPVAAALGGEWRKDTASGTIGADSGSGWVFANYKPNHGQITVKEAYAELAMPFFKGFTLDAAGRVSDYSTSGTAETWKVSSTYSPIEDVKLRASYSRDFRAPNMQDLFRPQTSTTRFVFLPSNSPAPGQHIVLLTVKGNPNLKPETGNTWTAGAVVTPRFIPGFAASFDYFDIKVKNAIGSLSIDQLVSFCYSGFSQFCNSVVFANGQPSEIIAQPYNFGGQHDKGFDIEASYRTPLSAISSRLPGTFSIHANVTHYIKNVVDNLVFPIDYAGVIGDYNAGPNRDATVPSWVYRVSAFYDVNQLSFNLTAHGFSSGVNGTAWVQCASNCPASTLVNPTINNNHIAGITYFDGSVSFDIKSARNDTRVTFIVNNIFNKAPHPVGLQDLSGTYIGFPRTAQPLFDVIGRVYRVSLVTKF